MYKLLLFLIFLIYNVNCLKLENLCRKEIFYYYNTLNGEDILVNSYFRLPMVKELNLENDFSVKNIELPGYWTQDAKTQIKEFNEQYEKFVSNKILDENYINRLRTMDFGYFNYTFEYHKADYYDLKKKLTTLFIGIKKDFSIQETDDKLIEYKNQLKNLEFFIYFLEQIRIDKIDYDVILKKDEFQLILDDLYTKLEDGQSFVIPYENRVRYFFEQIFGMKKFKFLDNKSKAIVEYDLFLPFTNQNYTDEKCLDSVNLSIFYTSPFNE